MSKLFVRSLAVFFSCITFTHAAQLPGNIAVHIAKTHYLHPMRLLHPYLDVWHMKGPLAEKAATASLKKRFANVSECTDNSEADVVLLLEPYMFYNAQLRVFHAEYIVRAYTSNGDPITRIKQQAQQFGELNIASDFYMEKGYTKAIEKAIAELSVNKEFLAALDKNTPIKAGDICNGLDLLPLEKLYY